MICALISVMLFNGVPAWVCLNEGAAPVFIIQQVTPRPIQVKSEGAYERAERRGPNIGMPL